MLKSTRACCRHTENVVPASSVAIAGKFSTGKAAVRHTKSSGGLIMK